MSNIAKTEAGLRVYKVYFHVNIIIGKLRTRKRWVFVDGNKIVKYSYVGARNYIKFIFYSYRLNTIIIIRIIVNIILFDWWRRTVNTRALFLCTWGHKNHDQLHNFHTTRLWQQMRLYCHKPIAVGTFWMHTTEEHNTFINFYRPVYSNEVLRCTRITLEYNVDVGLLFIKYTQHSDNRL